MFRILLYESCNFYFVETYKIDLLNYITTLSIVPKRRFVLILFFLFFIVNLKIENKKIASFLL